MAKAALSCPRKREDTSPANTVSMHTVTLVGDEMSPAKALYFDTMSSMLCKPRGSYQCCQDCVNVLCMADAVYDARTHNEIVSSTMMQSRDSPISCPDGVQVWCMVDV